jgi:hypothetical protein
LGYLLASPFAYVFDTTLAHLLDYGFLLEQVLTTSFFRKGEC